MGNYKLTEKNRKRFEELSELVQNRLIEIKNNIISCEDEQKEIA